MTARFIRSGIVALLAAAVLCGCSSPYRKLVPEDSLPDLHAAKVATLERHNHLVMAPTTGGSGPGVNIAIHEMEAAQVDRVLVMIHGVFADHETWRFVAGNLARDHGVWLVDLPGCGDSGALPAGAADAYTISDNAERTLQALRHCLSGRAPPRLALVGHSYGAAVIVRMLADRGLRERYSDVLDRVDRLVLISPLDIAMNAPSPQYRRIAEASGSKVRLFWLTGALTRKVAESTIASVADPGRALREEADKKIEVLRDSERRRALQGMIEKAVPWTKKYRPAWEEIEPLEAAYAEVDRDCLIMVGMRDEALPSSMSYKMAMQLTRAAFVPLRGVMHSPHIEAHERCATLIREFVTTGRVTGDVLKTRGLAHP